MPRSAELRFLRYTLSGLILAVSVGAAYAQSPDFRDNERATGDPILSPRLEDLRREIDPENDRDPFAGDRDADDERDGEARRKRGSELDGSRDDNPDAGQRESAEPGRDGDDPDTERAEQSERDDGRSDRDREAATRDPNVAGDREPEDAETVVGDDGPRDDDPYAPRGIRLGSFLIFPDGRVEQMFTSNALQSSVNAQADRAVVVTRNVTVRSDWSRHLLEGTFGMIRSYFSEFTEQNDKTDTARLRGRLDVSRDTNVEAAVRYEDSLEELSSDDTPAGAAERTPIAEQAAALQVSHRFNRMTALLRGGMSEIDYDDVALIGGGVANNDDRDHTRRDLGARLSYEFRPGVSGFVDGGVNERDYDTLVDDNGLRRNSAGYAVMAGLALDFGGNLTGEFAAGFARQTPEETVLEDISGLIFNAGLEWRATPLTTVRFDASSEVEETTASDSAGAILRTAEFSVEHAFRRNIVAGISVGYAEEDFSGSGQIDRDYGVGLAGEYFITRSLALTAAYDFIRSTSSVPGSDYIENEFRVGLRMRR